MGLGSGIRDPDLGSGKTCSDPGSRGQKGTGSATLLRSEATKRTLK